MKAAVLHEEDLHAPQAFERERRSHLVVEGARHPRAWGAISGAPAMTIAACRVCGQMQRVDALSPGMAAECPRCGAVVRRGAVDSLARTAAFSLTALILYVPANVEPILRMDYYGAHSESTVWDGCTRLFQDGEWFVALIVLLASIVIPVTKLLGLLLLTLSVKLKWTRWGRQRNWIHRAIEAVGPWAMLDVFLLAILVAIVKLGRLATVMPGPGLLAFTAVVVSTILASASFDSSLIWPEPEAVP